MRKHTHAILTSSRVHLATASIVVLFLLTLITTVSYDSFSYWFTYWWMFPIALIIALIVNTLGVSGAALFVPFFILIFPFFALPLTTTQSVQLGLITESFGLTSSALAFFVFGLVDRKLAFISVLGAIPFVVAGAFLTIFIPKAILLSMIAALLVISVLLIYYKKYLEKSRLQEIGATKIDDSQQGGTHIDTQSVDGKRYSYCRTRKGYTQRFFGYGIGGFFQGSAGFGIGELGIISMIMSKIPTRMAIGTSHVIVASTAILASIIHTTISIGATDAIPWNLPFMTVPAVVIGGQLAPFLAAKLPTKILEQFLSILFIIIAGALVLLVAYNK